ncbi:MAG: aminoglycoside phosphotransferase family protein [Streptomycetales bacterium]
MSAFELPQNLVRAAEKDDDAGSARRTWMADLPLVVDDVARTWSLEVGRPFQPGGVTSWVAPARNVAGEHLVLKVGWRHGEALHEADGLRAWAGGGAVRLINSLVVGETSALLLEACEPGIALSRALPPQEQDAVVAGLLGRLWIEPPAGHPFRSLQSMCDWWADEFEEKYAADAQSHRLDRGLLRVGMELFRSLPGTAERSVLLCTDLHPENVLAARRELWLVIDPKPYVGDPTYDPLQHMLNFPDRLIANPAVFVQRMADLLSLDAERLRHWLFARCLQESVDHPHLRNAVIALAPS